MMEGQDTGLPIPQTTIPSVRSFSPNPIVSLRALYLLRSLSAPIPEVGQMQRDSRAFKFRIRESPPGRDRMLIELSYMHDEKLTILCCNLLENESRPLMAWRTADLDLLDHLQDAVPGRCECVLHR
jgi:hypothetical protein